ncbi:MAG TPA: hypothetical protein VF285_03150 [Castellaniella sp.]|uniref:hypothetical protein n=1 Tax=Castellaniella sp. TaxID=1955812 RepID=UPI002F16D926
MTTDTALQPLPLAWATKIVERMHLLYGTAFMRQWEGLDKPQMAQAWAQEFAGFTGDEIARGLQACRSRPYVPSLPEFMRLCRPWLDPEIAFRAAVIGVQKRRAGDIGAWPHPAVYWAAVEIGQHDMLNQSWQTLRSRFSAALDVQLARRVWDPIPIPAAALPAPGQPAASSEQADAGIKTMAAAAIEKPRDPKAWARKILEHPEGRALIAVTMTKRALGEEVVA